MKNKVCGIYKITNNLNGMGYIGQSKDCSHRWCEHITHRKDRDRRQQFIDVEIKEFGKENFTFKILLECPPDMLDVWERDMINLHNTLYPNGYNRQMGGRDTFDVCEDSRRKWRESAKNRPLMSNETKIKMSKSHRGKAKHLEIKYKWLTPDGEIKYMDKGNVGKYHRDWTLLEKDL